MKTKNKILPEQEEEKTKHSQYLHRSRPIQRLD